MYKYCINTKTIEQPVQQFEVHTSQQWKYWNDSNQDKKIFDKQATLINWNLTVCARVSPHDCKEVKVEANKILIEMLLYVILTVQEIEKKCKINEFALQSPHLKEVKSQACTAK